MILLHLTEEFYEIIIADSKLIRNQKHPEGLPAHF